MGGRALDFLVFDFKKMKPNGMKDVQQEFKKQGFVPEIFFADVLTL